MWSFPWCQPKLCFVGSLLFLGDRSGRRQLSGVERLKTISASLDAKSPVELGLDAGGSRTQNAPTQLFLAMGIWWDMMGYDWYELMWIDMTCYSNYTIGLDRFWGRLAPFVACFSVNHYDHYRTLGYASQTDAKHCETWIQSSLARKISWEPDIQYMQPAKSKGLKNESAKTWAAESEAMSLKLTWELQIAKVTTFRGSTWLNKSQERNIDPDVLPMLLPIPTVPKHSFCGPSFTLRS